MLTRTDVDYVNDEHSAARMYLELRHQAQQPGIPSGQSTETKAAISKLLRTWPEAKQLAANASDDDLGGLSAGLKRTRNQHRKDLGVSAQQAANARRRTQRGQGTRPASPARRKTPPPAAVKPSRRPRSSPGRGGGGRRLKMPGLPPVAGVDTARSFGLQLVSLGLGLSLAYLLLADAENPGRGWPSALQAAINTLSAGVTAFVGLTDPLRPHAATGKKSGSAAGAALAATPKIAPAAVAVARNPRRPGVSSIAARPPVPVPIPVHPNP